MIAARSACGRERFSRLIRAAARRALPKDAGERTWHRVAPKVLAHNCTATAPNKNWVVDFTYIWTREGLLYAATALDLVSLRVVGWWMQSTMTSQLVSDALVMAAWRRGGPETLLHRYD